MPRPSTRDYLWVIVSSLRQHEKTHPRLMQLCGVGYSTVYSILAYIGNIQCFPENDKLPAYAGLALRLYQSGKRAFGGHITKSSNLMLRWLTVGAARSAMRFDHH